ncbi:hypothetical protein GOODEAATRI_010089 [Goodea atripinnis]|uniref:Thyroglobulin type-1 domain-containing protein n=1 Tax=Goodea atripinnis TaxID=208336 RepID=A0ABV0PMD8_9TELE
MVAGLTLLACVLIMSQAAIAYFLFSQRSDIRNLEDQNNKINTHLTREGSATPLTQCQLEAAGMKPVPVPGFRPICDKQGVYLPQQCFKGMCWCVNPVDGQQIPGATDCSRSAYSGPGETVTGLSRPNWTRTLGPTMVPLGPSRSCSRSHARGPQERDRRREGTPQRAPSCPSSKRPAVRAMETCQLLPCS